MVNLEPVYIGVIREGQKMTVEVTGIRTEDGFVNISATAFSGETIPLTPEEEKEANDALLEELGDE